ncbi:hypothetical protein EJ110_NYTH44541 [Nymphaea thermarum]|nr:hypothetical protein EJ110_NYTH44541 [Nymphaea thermarum]
MDIFLSTYEKGICVRREWLVRKGNWDQGSNWILTDVGSHPNCDIVISHPSVMYRHFIVNITKDTLDMWIDSLTGTGKLRVRGKEVKPYSKRQIYPGDVIQIGMMNSWMRIEAASWPEHKIPTIIETESNTESCDGSETSSPPESKKFSSDEEESCRRSAHSPSPPTIEELAQRMLERVDEMIEASKSRSCRTKEGLLAADLMSLPGGFLPLSFARRGRCSFQLVVGAWGLVLRLRTWLSQVGNPYVNATGLALPGQLPSSSLNEFMASLLGLTPSPAASPSATSFLLVWRCYAKPPRMSMARYGPFSLGGRPSRAIRWAAFTCGCSSCPVPGFSFFLLWLVPSLGSSGATQASLGHSVDGTPAGFRIGSQQMPTSYKLLAVTTGRAKHYKRSQKYTSWQQPAYIQLVKWASPSTDQ